MKIRVYQIGEKNIDDLDQVIEVINSNQTLWRLERAANIKRPDSLDAQDIIAIIPPGERGERESFSIGVTAGEIAQKENASLIYFHEKKALVSYTNWKLWTSERKETYPDKIFWAFTLSNICFQAILENGCSQKYCIGYVRYSFNELLWNLLNLKICNSCKFKLIQKYKYQVREVGNLIAALRSPMDYGQSKNFEVPSLEVLARQINTQATSGNTKIFQDYGIFIVMHFLDDLVPFLEGLITLGAREESIVIAVKPYPYQQRLRLHSYLYRNRPSILVEYFNEFPPSEGILEELLIHCKSKSQRKKVIVIEDGGYIAPFLHRKYNKKTNFCIGSVEQTTRGLRKIEDVGKKRGAGYLFPILDVAKSRFKEEYESPLVAHSIISSLQKLLPEENFSGGSALVVGFGATGREIAYALKNIGMNVKVYDKEKRGVVAAQIRGFVAEERPEGLLKNVKLVLGTTGDTSIDKRIIDKLENGAILASASSDQVEIDIKYLGTIDRSGEYEEGLGSNFRKGKGRVKDTYLLLGDGFPINFYSGSGIPNKSIDPILAQLFIGAVHLATEHRHLKKGINRIMDELNEKYNLIEDYLACAY